MNRFQQHIKNMPESESPYLTRRVAPESQTVVTHSNGITRGVTRMSYPQLQQIPRVNLDLTALRGLKVRHIDINLTEQLFIQSHS